MAHRKLIITNNEDETFPGNHVPRFNQFKFSPGKYHQLEPLNHPPLFNGDEGIQKTQRLFLHSKNKFNQTSVSTAKKKELLLTEGLLKLDDQWATLEKKEVQLKAVVRRFNKFIRENVTKRERFTNTIKRSQEHFKKYNAETEKMKEKTSHLQRILEQMKIETKKHDIYENFLWKVVATSTEFKTIYTFVTRFRVLISTLEDSTSKFMRYKSFLLLMLHQINAKMHQEASIVNRLMNRLCKLGHVMNDVTTKNQVSEKIICDVHRETKKTMGDVYSTLDLMNQLYLNVCSRENKKASITNGDYKHQIMVVQRALQNFERVLKVCNVGMELQE